MRWKIRYTLPAEEQLAAIKDRRIQRSIYDRAEALASEPEKQGKQLADELAAYRSVRAVGQRYRIIYQIDESQGTVVVVSLGLRKEGSKTDVYTLTKRLVRLGLLKPEEEE